MTSLPKRAPASPRAFSAIKGVNFCPQFMRILEKKREKEDSMRQGCPEGIQWQPFTLLFSFFG